MIVHDVVFIIWGFFLCFIWLFFPENRLWNYKKKKWNKTRIKKKNMKISLFGFQGKNLIYRFWIQIHILFFFSEFVYVFINWRLDVDFCIALPVAYIRKEIRTDTFTNTHSCRSTNIEKHTHTHTHAHTHTHTNSHTHIYMCARVFVCVGADK